MDHSLLLILCSTLIVLSMPILVNCQITALCTSSMIQSFAPCMNFASKSGGSSPTEGCCTALKYLMGNGTDCLCLIATGGVPFKSPINPDLAMSLPKACKMSGVPIECKATGSPLPAPGPEASNSPPTPGTFVPGLTPDGGLTPPGLTPNGGSPPAGLTPNAGLPGLTPPNSDLTPPSTPPGTRPTLSATPPSHKFSPTLLLVMCAATVLKYL